MDAEQLLKAITPEVYDRLVYAVETGRWPEGTTLSKEQRDSWYASCDVVSIKTQYRGATYDGCGWW